MIELLLQPLAKSGTVTDSRYTTIMGLSGCSHATGNTHRVPTIRVIHIDAPKIVRTDVANFRSVVQLLTGNESSEGRGSTAVYEPVHENLIQRSCQGAIRAIKGCEVPQFQHQERVCVMKPDYYYYKEDSPGFLANEGYFCMWGENEKRLHMDGQISMQDRFSEQDIIAGLISGEPLPDITMLPPLV